jgi:hypothetical protein
VRDVEESEDMLNQLDSRSSVSLLPAARARISSLTLQMLYHHRYTVFV